MRLFIAVTLGGEMKSALRDIQEQIKKQNIGGNFTKLENLHLTLAFIGEYSDPDRAAEALGRVSFKPFRISLDGIGCFGNLWWAGIRDGGELQKCAAQVRHCLADARIPFDRKRFSPHITLIREASRPIKAGIIVPEAGMTVEKLSLMRSDRGKSGMIYTETASVSCSVPQTGR